MDVVIPLLGGLIFVYLLRLILPLPGRGASRLPLVALLLLVAQHQVFLRYAINDLAAPELPMPVLLALGWGFVALLFLVLLLLIRDMFLLLPRLIRGAKQRVDPPFAPGRRQVMIAAMAALPAAYCVGQGVRAPGVHRLETRLPRLPGELDGLILVQISDLHISPLLGEQRVRAMVDTVNALEPDLILFTGDVVDGMPEDRAASIAHLRNLRARYGMFGCTGNHEYYSDCAAWRRALSALGLTMLLNSHVVLKIRGRELVVAGVTDKTAEHFFLPGPDIAEALAGAPADAVRILLDHRPGKAAANARAGVDLQLSGHTHGGQIAGINRLAAQFNQGFLSGWYQVGAMRLYVSSGAGSWGMFPVRFGVPVEIARIVLRCAE